MDGRAQVILVITGLGAPTLEETIPGISLKVENCSDAATFESIEQEVIPTHEAETVEAIAIDLPQSAATNIDLPAFLRRRNR